MVNIITIIFQQVKILRELIIILKVANIQKIRKMNVLYFEAKIEKIIHIEICFFFN